MVSVQLQILDMEMFANVSFILLVGLKTAIVHRWEFEDLWIPECFLNRILKNDKFCLQVFRSMGFRVDKMVYGFSDKMVSFATSVVKL
uniref:Uncharacterized protein n=1 Tax=Rhizophagus irregularis (strain DAOM 181602 / DAOM 197198 / MUCL 43194) TaxID=747089 RepID=U9T4A4_RHIID